MSSLRGFVFNIQRHSIHDGPGIRTILFLKGCPMFCEWCSNPESHAFTGELSFDPARCIGCGACLGVCPAKAITKAGDDSGGLSFNREACTACGACAEICYAGARTIEGREMTVEEAGDEICRDELFFRRSGGGLTLGGGEPLSQPDFAAAVLSDVHSRGLSTAVETAGHVPWESFEKVLPFTDYFLFDIKHTDAEKHKRFTGAGVSLIQENLKKLASVHPCVIARTPVIPGFNNSAEELLAIAGLALSHGLTKIDLLPYHGYGSGKYGLLGKTYPMKNHMPLPGTAEMTALLENLKPSIEATGLKVQIGG